MNNKLKEFWFKYYVFIVLFFLSLIIAAFSILTVQVGDSYLASVATFAGIALTTIYFVQKQKLEEIKLFKDYLQNLTRDTISKMEKFRISSQKKSMIQIRSIKY